MTAMPRKPTKPDDPEQSKLPIEMPEEVSPDDLETLERAIETLIPVPKRRPSKK
jgi:hypothetical protein